jgi:predicted MFS family arabinose efflux permease
MPEGSPIEIPPRRFVRRLGVARGLSITGSSAADIALSYAIYQTTQSAIWVAATFLLAFGITGLLSPFAGLLADRVDRRRLMITSELLGALVWLALILVHSPAGLLLLVFVAALVELPFAPASGAAIPNLVDEADLSWANSLVAIGRNVGLLVGPALGGTLAALTSPRAVFFLNAVSFVVSAALIATVHGRFSSNGGHEDSLKLRDAFAGLPLIWSDPVLRSIFLLWTILYLVVDMTLVADVPLARSFGLGAFGYGLLNAFWGGGAVLGSLAARRLKVRFESIVLLLGPVAIMVGYATISISRWFALVLAGMLFAAFFDSIGTVAGQSVFQRRTVDSIRGRVLGTLEASSLLARAAGFVSAGFLVAALGPRSAYALAAAVSGCSVLLLAPLWRGRQDAAAVDQSHS